MSRYLLFVMLLMAPAIVPADVAPEAEPAADEAEAKARSGEQTEPAEKATEEKDTTDESAATEAKSDKASEEAVTAAGTQAETDGGPKFVSGMSILGNQEAPKSLVIVPWKSSELGDSLGISTMLDDSRQPIDRDVFMRALSYYEIRSEK